MRMRELTNPVIGIVAGTMLTGVASSALAEQRQPERQFQIYKCSVCGTVVKILEAGTTEFPHGRIRKDGTLISSPYLVHCDERMKMLGIKPDAGFKMRPIGHVKKIEGQTLLVLDEKYQPGLLGVDGYSHIYVIWWFDKNDTPEKRATLQVHPMGNRENPLTGVFGTRSPRRPNLVALTLCKIVAVKDNMIEIEKTDAFDGTPVLDIKPFIPGYDTAEEAKVPDWLERARKKRAAAN